MPVGTPPLTRLAWLSIVAAVATIALKTMAYLRYRAKGSTDTMFRGMLLHLAWWMELGAAIRAAALS